VTLWRGTQRIQWADALMQNRFYVGNLAEGVAATTLHDLGTHGFLMDVKLVRGGKTGRLAGYAMLTMATDESAKSAMMALRGTNLHGVMIAVQVAGDAGALCGGSHNAHS
jgi:hypothetical protein